MAICQSPRVNGDAPAELDCLLQPDMVVDIASQVDGILSSVSVDASDRVEKGQIIAHLDDSLQTATANLAHGRASVKDGIDKRRANLEFAQGKLKKIRELHLNKHVSDLDLDKAEIDASRAEIDLHQARSDQYLAELDYKRAEVLLNLHNIRSPVSGVVMERLLVPGESVKDKAIVKVAKIDPLRVMVIVPSEAFGQIKPGDPVDVLVEAPLNRSVPATVAAVDQVIDAASGSFGVRLNLPNPDYSLPSGLKCRARFASLRLPQNAAAGLPSPQFPKPASAAPLIAPQTPLTALSVGKP